MPNLTVDEYERLKEDIRLRGVLDALIYDEDGRLLDGHNRKAIATELGIDYPVQVLDLGDAGKDERDRVAATLNINRRQLTPTQQRELAIQFRINGVDVHQTADLVGASPRAVKNWTASAVGKNRRTKIEQAKALVETGASQNEAAKAVGIPRQTLARHVAQKGKSAPLGKPAKPAPLRKSRPIPGWSRHFSSWCRGSRPEDRVFLSRLDREIHAALKRNGLTCQGEASA